MVRVEDLAGILEIEPIRRRPAPRQLHDPVEVVAHDLGFGAVGVHALEPPELAHRLVVTLAREVGLLDLEAILVGLLTTRVDFAELALDGAELFAQEGFALAPAHLLVGLGLDLGLHRRDFELAAQQRIDPTQAREGVGDLEDLLRFGEAEAQVRGDQISEAAGLLDVGGDREDLRRQVLERQEFLDATAHGADQRFALDAEVGEIVARDLLDAHPRRGVVFDDRLDAGLRDALHEHLQSTVGHARAAHHHRDRADLVEVVGVGVRGVRVALRDEEDPPITRERILDSSDRLFARDEQRQHHVREDHELPERKDGQLQGRISRGGNGCHGAFFDARNGSL